MTKKIHSSNSNIFTQSGISNLIHMFIIIVVSQFKELNLLIITCVKKGSNASLAYQ